MRTYAWLILVALLLCTAGTITRLSATRAVDAHKENSVDVCLVSEFYAELHEIDFVDASPLPRRVCQQKFDDALIGLHGRKTIQLTVFRQEGRGQFQLHEERIWDDSISARRAAFRYYVRAAEGAPFALAAVNLHNSLMMPVLMFESRVRTHLSPAGAHAGVLYAGSSATIGVRHNQTTIGILRNLYYSIRNGYVRRRIAHANINIHLQSTYPVQSHSAILHSHYPSILKDLTCSTRSTRSVRTGHGHSLPSKHNTRSMLRRDGVRT